MTGNQVYNSPAMAVDANSDGGLLEWAIGVFVVLLSAMGGHLHLRINRIEDATRAMIDAATDARLKDDREKWRAITENREVFEAFARTVVTKEDLRDFERRLGQLLDARTARP